MAEYRSKKCELDCKCKKHFHITLKCKAGCTCKKHIVSAERGKKIGDKIRGRKATPETIQKLRDSHLGKIPGNKGKKGLQIGWSKGLTKETNQSLDSLSRKMIGNKNGSGLRSPSVGENISKAKKGKPQTSEHRLALKTFWEEHPDKLSLRIKNSLKGSGRHPNKLEKKLLFILNFIVDYSKFI